MDSLQTQILTAALPDIVFDGWTETTLKRAAVKAGLSEFDVKRAFPNGVVNAVDAFTRQADEQMLEALRCDYDMKSLKIRERIATAVMVRLRQQTPHREAVRRALAIYAMPWNMGAALQSLYATCDAIWRAAGDTSTDYNFYTKRLLLSQVYTTTMHVWLDDTSDDLAETEAFLRRRIENVMQIEKLKAKTRDAFGKWESWVPNFSKKA